MNESLLHLYELQKIDTHLDELVESRGELPEKVDEVKSFVEEQRTRLADVRDRLKELEDRYKLLNDESLEIRERLDKYKNQQFDVKTTREYDAVGFQVEEGQKKLESNMEESGRIGIELERIRIEESELSSEVETATKDLKDVKKMLGEVLKETEAEKKELLARKAEVLKLVKPSHLSMYNRVRPAKNGIAVVPLRNLVCGGCFNAVPRQLVLDLNKGIREAVCEYCGRIIVGEPISLAIDGEPEPVSTSASSEEEAETSEE